jgi:Peptidase family M28
MAAFLLVAPAASAEVVSGRRAKEVVHVISAAGPRPAGSARERRAGRIVAARFRELGLPVTIQRFRLPRGGASLNVVARTPGRTRVIVVAHMDGVREGPAANDNASGVAAMLEVAAVLAETEGLLFAALGAEERVETGSNLHLGSVRLMRSLPRAVRPEIRLALSLDMVGVGPTLTVRGLESRPNRSSRFALARARALRLSPVYLPDSGVSDHAEMTRGGIPASLLTWRWDSCWHEACDRARRVSARKLASAARVAIASARAALRPQRSETVATVQGNGARTRATSPAPETSSRNPRFDQWFTWPGVFPSAPQ